MYKKKKEISLKKHSAMIQMTNIVTAQQRKIFNSLILIARKNGNENDKNFKNIFKTELKIIEELAGIKSTNKKRLKESILKLTNITVEYNILKKDNTNKWGAFALLSWIEAENNILKYTFPPPIIEAIKNPSIYSFIDMIIIKGLESKYTIALYELIIDYINVEIPKMKIEDFKKLMGVKESQYTDIRDLKRRVIDPASKELSEKCKININYEFFKEGRKVKEIKLRTSKNKSVKKFNNKEEKPKEIPLKILCNEANKCFTKNSGSCRALWTRYSNDKSSPCHFCAKFEKQREIK